MKSIRKWLRNVFGFSGTEINGFIILIPLMILLVFSEPLYHSWLAGNDRTYDEERVVLDSLMAQWERQPVKVENPEQPPRSDFFQFDPNNVSVAELSDASWENYTKWMASQPDARA